MCFSAADGNSGGGRPFQFRRQLRKFARMFGRTGSHAGADFVDCEETCTDRSVGATRRHSILFIQVRIWRKFYDAHFPIIFHFNCWRVKAKKLATPPHAL